MKIYIPKHLRELEIYELLANVIQEYSKNYVGEAAPFEYYNKDRSINPVKRFVEICRKEEEFEDTEQVSNKFANSVLYISKLFYNVKGTEKVIDYIRQFLNLNLEVIEYTTDILIIRISKVEISDRSLFETSFRDFLNELLYFRELHLIIEHSEIILEGEVSNAVGSGFKQYKKLKVTDYGD